MTKLRNNHHYGHLRKCKNQNKSSFFMGFVTLFSSSCVVLSVIPILLVHMGHLEVASLSGTLGNIKYSYSLVNTPSIVRELDHEMARQKAAAMDEIAKEEERLTFFNETLSLSKLRVIVTGMEHTGTNLLAELIMSVPGLNGPFESGFLLAEEPSDFTDHNPWYEWLERNDPLNEFLNLQPKEVDELLELPTHSDVYNYVMEKSPLFHNLNERKSSTTASSPMSNATNATTTLVHQDGYVDHTPFYIYNLPKVIERAPPKTRVVVLMQKYQTVHDAWIKKHGHTHEHFEESFQKYLDNLVEAQEAFPYQVYLVRYDDLFDAYFTKGDRMSASQTAQDLFDWLELPWDIRYFTGENFALKQRQRTCSLCDITHKKLGTSKKTQ